MNRPLDEQPLLGMQPGLANIAASVAHPHSRKAVVQCIAGSLAPTDVLERPAWQRLRQLRCRPD